MILLARIKIWGRVRGVFFRDSAKKKAEEFGLKGFIRNEFDEEGIYIEAEGEKENLEQFIKWCRKGPAFAMVQGLDFHFSSELKNYEDFKIVS